VDPVISAQGLGLRTRRGWVFRDVDLDVFPGELVAVAGPGASGRTSLLLALAGRFATSTGKVVRHGRADLGYVPGVTDLEPNLTLRDHLRERQLLVGGGARQAAPRSGTPEKLARDISALDRQLWGLALATVAAPAVVLVDDVDSGLSTEERDELWSELRKLAIDGIAVVAACREVPDGTADRVIILEKS
jgi:ABC-2 type transport system ATP-binding protein